MARPSSRRDRSAARCRADNGRNCAGRSLAIRRCSPPIRGARASPSRCSRGSFVPSGSGRSTIALIDAGTLLVGTEERMAPDAALRRNEKAKRRKPVLVDEMFERHRRRMDIVIEIVDALRVVELTLSGCSSGPVLRGRDGLALRAGGGKRPSNGTSVRCVASSRATRAPSPDRGARRAGGAGCSAKACARPRARRRAAIGCGEPAFVFDPVARHAVRWRSDNSRISSTGARCRPRDSAAGLCPNRARATSPALSTRDWGGRRDFGRFRGLAPVRPWPSDSFLPPTSISIRRWRRSRFATRSSPS